MKIDEALDKYNEGNPIARWIRSHTPPGYLNRWIMLSGMGFILLVSVLWASTQAEPYIECSDRAGCIHPETGALIPDGYTEGTPISQQLLGFAWKALLIFGGVLAVNHAYWGISTRGGRI